MNGISREETASSSNRAARKSAAPEAQPSAPVIPPYGPWPLVAGEVYEIRFPFKRGKYEPYPDYEDPASGGTFCAATDRAMVETWVPGWDEGETYYGPRHWCEGWGAEIRTVIGVFQPGRYPERCFYVRRWRDPDGRVFGKKKLRILASRDFRNWARGTRYHRAFSHMVCDRWEAESAEPDVVAEGTPPLAGSGSTS